GILSSTTTSLCESEPLSNPVARSRSSAMRETSLGSEPSGDRDGSFEPPSRLPRRSKVGSELSISSRVHWYFRRRRRSGARVRPQPAARQDRVRLRDCPDPEKNTEETMRICRRHLALSVLAVGLLGVTPAFAGPDEDAVAKKVEAFRAAQMGADA